MTVILLKFSILWVVATWILLNFGMIFNAENDKDDKTLVDIEEYVPLYYKVLGVMITLCYPMFVYMVTYFLFFRG